MATGSQPKEETTQTWGRSSHIQPSDRGGRKRLREEGQEQQGGEFLRGSSQYGMHVRQCLDASVCICFSLLCHIHGVMHLCRKDNEH